MMAKSGSQLAHHFAHRPIKRPVYIRPTLTKPVNKSIQKMSCIPVEPEDNHKKSSQTAHAGRWPET
jgi:hypothetical protein